MDLGFSEQTYRELGDELCRQGWTVERSGHRWHATSGDQFKGTVVVITENPSTPVFMNTIRNLQQQGFRWPPPSKAELASERRASAVSSVVRATPFPPVPMDVKPTPPRTAVVVQPAPPAAPAPTADSEYASLLEAKEYAALAIDIYADAEKRLADAQIEAKRLVDDAQTRLDNAARDRDRAVTTLKQRKADFDRAFELV